MPLQPLTILLRRAPAWLLVGALGLIVYPLTVFALGGGEPFGNAVDMFASAVRLLLEGAAFLWAHTRIDLPPRLRTALRITGWASIAGALNYLVLLSPDVGGPALISDSVDAVWTLAVYAAASWALLVYPRRPATPSERWPLLIDLVITAGGLGLLGWTLVTVPSAVSAETTNVFRLVLVFGVAQIALLIGVNLVVVRGLAVPSRRAFWLFVAGQAAYVPLVVLAQFERAGYTDPAWGNAVYHFGVLPTLGAALTMRADPVAATPETSRVGWVRDFNPLPLGVPVAVGGGLLLVLARGPVAYALPLAATLVAVALLLALRLLLSARQSALRALAQAEVEDRRQQERLQTVARLAGGIAHEFNNLMMRVMGHTELGDLTVPPDAPARRHFAGARTAAQRAATLTTQLLAFSGQQRTSLAPLDLAAFVRAAGSKVTSELPRTIAADVRVNTVVPLTLADEAQLEGVLGQLVRNAAEAMPSGGRLSIDLEERHLAAPLATPLLSVPKGATRSFACRTPDGASRPRNWP